MGKKGGSKILMLLGVVLALIAGGVVFVLASGATSTNNEPEPRKLVVVAKQDIPERSKLTRDLLDTVNMPESVIPPGAYLKLEDIVDKKFAKTRLFPRMPITNLQTADSKPDDTPPVVQPATGPAAKPAIPKLVEASYTLDSGQTIVAVDYPEAAKLIAAGLLKPGDRVNIFIKVAGGAGEQVAEVFPSSNPLIQPQPRPLEIKAIGNFSQTTEAAPSTTMIFQVSPREAIVLKLLENLNPFFLVHPAVDKDNPTIRTDVMTSDQVQQAVGLRPAGGGAAPR